MFPNVYTEGIAEPKKFELGTVGSSYMLSNRCKIVGLNSLTFYLIALIGSNLYFNSNTHRQGSIIIQVFDSLWLLLLVPN